MKIYISGAISNSPDYLRHFEEAEKALQAAGYEVLNPAPYTVEGWTWADYMKKDLADLETCEGVCLVWGWWFSPGATLEIQKADDLGYPVHTTSWWLAKAQQREESNA